MRKSDLICLYCGKKTTGSESPEHIIPQNIGAPSTPTLLKGDVCKSCNNRLGGQIDESMRKHPAMAMAFQLDDKIKGARRSGERKRKQRQKKKEINGLSDSKILHYSKNGIDLIDANLLDTSVDFLRAWHKCVANILCNVKGSKYVRDSFPDLIEFVKTGKSLPNWSYAVSYTGNSGFCSSPLNFTIELNFPNSINPNYRLFYVCGIIHTSGIWIGSTMPNGMSKSVIEMVSSKIKKIHGLNKYLKYFGSQYPLNQEPIGDLNFYWAKP